MRLPKSAHRTGSDADTRLRPTFQLRSGCCAPVANPATTCVKDDSCGHLKGSTPHRRNVGTRGYTHIGGTGRHRF